MTTPGVTGLEPRNVVLASVGDARVAEAASELEELRERMDQIAAEVEAGEHRTGTAPSQADLSESAQLTLQFVDDLVSTNRQRMRDQVSQRYAWAGERLTGAQAEAQALVRDALVDLTSAMADHDGSREHHLDGLPIAALMASIATGGHDAPVSPELATEIAVVAERGAAAHGAVRDDLEARDPGAGAEDPALHGPVGADSAAIHGPPVPGHTTAVAGLAAEVGTAGPLDGVVDSAVQAILKALTEPGADSRSIPVPPPLISTAAGSPTATPARDRVEVVPDSAPASSAPEPSRAVGGDARVVLGEGEGAGEDAQARGYGDFWGDKVPDADARRSRLRPRDVMIAMVVLVALVLMGLALIG